jgi:hypothetical protein
MTIDEQVIEDLKEAIATVEAEMNSCNAVRADAQARDHAERSTSGGYARDMDTGIAIPDCSELENELRRLEEESARAVGGAADPSFPESTPYEKAAMQAAKRKAERALQEAKTAASRGADDWNEAAADMTMLSSVLPGPLDRGTTLLSGLFWRGSIKWSKLSKDPPRPDFQTVSKFKPFAFKLNPPASDFEATFQDFGKLTAFAAIAVEALTESLERYLAVSALRSQYESVRYVNPTIFKARAVYEIHQTEAVGYNAKACARFVDALLLMRPKVNLAWLQFTEQLDRAAIPSASLSPQELSKPFAEQWRANMLLFQDSFRLNAFQMKEVMEHIDRMILEQKFSSELPEMLLDGNWYETMQALSVQLRQLSAAYANLNTVLRESWEFPAVEPSPETLGYSLLASGLAVADDEKALASSLNSGVQLEIAFWVAKRDMDHGWWGVVPAGIPPDKPPHSTTSADVFLLPPGEYDVYWKQDYHTSLCCWLAR